MNPFKPGTGKTPPILIGREANISDFSRALDEGAGAPGRLMLVCGQRGSGKTALLAEFGRIARAEGWPTILETADRGVCSRIIKALEGQVSQASGAATDPSQTASAGTISWFLRLAIGEALKRVEAGKGVFVSVDEGRETDLQDMIALATTVQHIIGDQDMEDLPDSQRKGIAFALAGLPPAIDELLDEGVLTFLCRSRRHELGAVSITDVQGAYLQTVAEHGKHVSETTALRAAEASHGYPFLIQLVGHQLWKSADARHSEAIEEADVDRAVTKATHAFEEAVCAPIFQELSKPQQRFVLAMRDCHTDSITPDELAKRTGKSMSWVRRHRWSLSAARIIHVDGDGAASFSIPHFASYLARAIP